MRDRPDPLRALPARYRLLLRLLPAHVRDEHAQELRADLRFESPPMPRFASDILRASLAAHADVLRQDLTVAFRQMRRAPTFTIVAVLTLAAGIGGNVAFFTLVDGVLLRQLRLAGAERVVDITEENIGRGMRSFGIAPANFRDVARADTTLYSAAAVYNGRTGTVRVGEDRERVAFSAVGGEFFRVFFERPLLGRTLQPEDDAPGATTIVLAYDFWRRTLGGDANIVGRDIEVDGKPLRVVGVMPEGFAFPNTATAFWQPIGLAAAEWERRGARWVQGVARLRPGVTLATASASADAVARSLAATFPRSHEGWSVLVRELRASRVDRVRTPLLLVWGAGALVLLIAIANVASLLLTRAVARERELALRVALGARVGRVVRQLATEAAVLSAVSAVAGIGIAWLVLERVRPLASDFVPRMNEVTVDTHAIAYSAALALATTLVLTLFALTSARRDRLWSALGTGRASTSRHRRRIQRAIVVGEVALAVFVMVAGGLVFRTLNRVLSQPMGFDSRDALTFRVEPPWRARPDTSPARYFESIGLDRRRANEELATLMSRLEALPGVQRAGAVNRLPLTGEYWTSSFALPERQTGTENDRIPAYTRPVTPSYFDAMRTRVLRGRAIGAADDANAERVIVVDAELARRAWGYADPIGRDVLLDGPPNHPRPRARVIGVVETVHMNRLDAEPRPTMYVPFVQALEGHYLNWGMDVVVRSIPGSRLQESDVRRVVRDVFPDAVVFRVAAMDDIIARSTADRRFQLFVLGFFGALALLLATIGVSGTILLSVRERREELAVRLALGAGRRRLWWAVQRDGLALAGGGALIGIAGALASARVFSSIVYGVETRDPASLLMAGALVVLAAFAATAIPAVGAMRVNPVVAMRE